MTDPTQANILVVDDTRANLRFLAKILSQQGYAVRPALNGKTALASVAARPPDLILLDIMMPGIDGYAVCEALKADPATRDIPVIFLSALDEVTDKVKAFAIGGVDYITKPFQVEEVLARVRTHLALRDLQQRLEEQNATLQTVNGALKREIAERERAEAALRQHAAELEASNAELDAFAHTVAHDLKTPLTALIGFSMLLQQRHRQWPSDRVDERLALITQSGHKMTSIIDELLLLASVRQMDEVELGPLTMGDIVGEVLVRFSDPIKTSDANVVVPETWPVAVGYGPWIEEVWVNYVSNALKYGGTPPHVTLGATILDFGLPISEKVFEIQHPSSKTQNPKSKIVFWVRDNGPGLSQAEQARLFTQFTRLHEVRAEGHGLGLSIVQRIIDKLQGEVGVESTPGEGSTFWFTLPGCVD